MGAVPPRAAMRVLLVANYPPDAQQSMLRFAALLARELPGRGITVETLAPPRVFGRKKAAYAGAGKWLAYLDKYLLFPWRLRWHVRGLGAEAVVHICDHSNAMYAAAAGSGGAPVVVTCHDLGAVRGALGEATDCPASWAGRLLQRWITRSLGRAHLVACVSSATRDDVLRLVRTPAGDPPHTRVVPMGLNAPYRALPAAQAEERLRVFDALDLSAPFALHVGSSLRRKNREGVLRIFAAAQAGFSGQLIFAGEALPPQLVQLAGELGLAGRVLQILEPSNDLLEALYSRAFALLFPSRFEGFGWPVIEAQACGCPVLCSNAGSLAEVAGGGAFVAPADDEAAFAAELMRLAADPAARASWIEKGTANLARFRTETMIDRYRRIYEDLLTGPAPLR